MVISSSKIHKTNLSQTALKTLDTLECLASANHPLSTREVAQHCGLSRPTAYRLLSTLLSRGYVEKTLNKHYCLGPRVLSLSKSLLDRLDLPELAKQDLHALCLASDETVHLAILDNTEALYVSKVESSQAVRMHSAIGTRNPLHSTAIGKSILAFLPLEERTALLDRMILTRRTHNTITDKTVLVEHLDAVHTQGFAIDDIEEEEGMRCVGAPIFNHTARAIGAVSISGPAYRLSIARLEELSQLVRKTAEVISFKLGYIPGQDS